MRLYAVTSALIGAISALAISKPTEPSTYSAWMINSIISRGQGLGSSGAATSQIELGIFQSALRQAIETTRHSKPKSGNWSSYLTDSLQNSLSTIPNATKDASEPLDRFSIGSALLYQHGLDATGTTLVALSELRKSTDLQSRNYEGGFWYYAAYPQWSYNDGMFSLPAWYIHYTQLYEPQNLTAVVEDVVRQFDLLWNHTYRAQDGLIVHGYDDSRTAVWANSVTGASSIVWGRSMAWHLIGLVETLDILPKEFVAARIHLQTRFSELANAIVEAADNATGVWWQVVDQGGRQGNYLESSASALFTYSILRGARLGYAKESCIKHITAGKRAWEYMRDRFVVANANGTISWNETVAVCSLNSSATYEYYVSRPISFNSLIGSSAFVLASLEYEQLHNGTALP